MANADQEIEAKFMVRNLPGIAERLHAFGAEMVSPRVRETNLRFDTPTGELTRTRQVLRLRQDAAAVMTYKGAPLAGQDASVRQEIEFQVNDFNAAQRLLEALGYQVSVIYEKYRTTYRLGSVLVTLDEMPYGSFIEIEGAGAGSMEVVLDSVRAAAANLRLEWEARSSASYLALFDILRQSRGLTARHLTFAELEGVSVQPQDLNLGYADPAEGG